MHDFQEQCQVHGPLMCLKINCERCDNALVVIFFKTMYNKKLLDSVFAISGIIKVSVSVIGRSQRLRLITLTSTLIIPDITKTSSNNCLKLVPRTGNSLWNVVTSKSPISFMSYEHLKLKLRVSLCIAPLPRKLISITEKHDVTFFNWKSPKNHTLVA